MWFVVLAENRAVGCAKVTHTLKLAIPDAGGDAI
jgi:hypothetical protein